MAQSDIKGQCQCNAEPMPQAQLHGLDAAKSAASPIFIAAREPQYSCSQASRDRRRTSDASQPLGRIKTSKIIGLKKRV